MSPWLLGALLTLTVGAVPAPALGATAEWRSAIDAAVHDAVAAGQVPGAVVLVGQGDRILYRQAAGWRALVPAPEPMTVDTVFDLASLTKVVATTPAVLALSEAGRVELDAPLARYLPELDGTPYGPVTLRQVLTHASGIPDPPWPNAGSGDRPDTRGLARVAVAATPPGTTFRYVDDGFVLLGELVHRVTGEPLDRFVSRRFFAPLALGHTRFNPPAAWRPRIAPTEVVGGRLLRGVVHDPLARRLGGVAGHAGLFSNADDLARFCRMLLGGGRLDGRRYLGPATVRAMFEPEPVGGAVRGLGWDVASPFSHMLGPYFPAGSLGHTGFTGTAMWLDPPSRSYLIILTSRVHPRGQGSVAELRRRVTAAVGAALFGGDAPPAPAGSVPPPAGGPTPSETRSGLDRLVADGFALLHGRSVGLVTNQTGVDHRGRRGIDLLAAAPGVRLRALFAPEHGLDGNRDDLVPDGQDAATGLPVWSLYGRDRRPSAAMLTDLDTLVFDVQDVGVRYYTYLATLVSVLSEAGRRQIAVVVLDRPNPITGRVVEGPVGDPDLESFTAPHPIPVRTGLTIGEFARMVVAERRLPVRLIVVPLDGWRRDRWFDETGLPWVNPSPNIRTPAEALLYAGIGLLEATNVSVGRGTETPFELVGAPWLTDSAGSAARLNAVGLPGVRFEPTSFRPVASTYAGHLLPGIRLVVTDREAIRPVTVALALARELGRRYPQDFRAAGIQELLVNRRTLWALLRGDALPRLSRWAEADLLGFLARARPYLLYP